MLRWPRQDSYLLLAFNKSRLVALAATFPICPLLQQP